MFQEMDRIEEATERDEISYVMDSHTGQACYN